MNEILTNEKLILIKDICINRYEAHMKMESHLHQVLFGIARFVKAFELEVVEIDLPRVE